MNITDKQNLTLCNLFGLVYIERSKFKYYACFEKNKTCNIMEYMEDFKDAEHIKFEDLLEKCIYDDVHGFVALTEKEKRLLSHPYMQRLHFIKQNALANFVFPGATHTRFSHSIGVLHIVEKMIQKLKTLPKNKIDIDPIDHQVVRLAALLHDVGHYPLSHTIENCFKEYDRHFLQQKSAHLKLGMDTGKHNNFFDNLRTPKDILKDFPSVSAGNSKFHHEKIAAILISDNRSPLKNIIIDILKDTYRKTHGKSISMKKIEIYIKLIGMLICGAPNLYTDSLSLKEIEKYYLLSFLINSNLDADQMDYMCRDTKNTGIQTTIRIDFLIDNMDICYIKVDGQYQPVICFNYKAFESVQQFLLSKEYWYTEIIFYDKVNILNRIAERLYMYSIYKENNINSIEEFYEKILFNQEEYIRFNDTEFWNRIYSLYSKQSTPRMLKKLIDILIGKIRIPRALTGSQLDSINDADIKKFFKTSIMSQKINDNIKNHAYNLIDETFKNKGEKVFSLYFSNKFLDSPTGEIIKDKYANRSIYILSSPCLKKNICDKECLNAVELLNASKLGKNLIHQLLDIRTDTDIRNDVPKSAFIEKCLVYDFNLRPV